MRVSSALSTRFSLLLVLCASADPETVRYQDAAGRTHLQYMMGCCSGWRGYCIPSSAYVHLLVVYNIPHGLYDALSAFCVVLCCHAGGVEQYSVLFCCCAQPFFLDGQFSGSRQYPFCIYRVRCGGAFGKERTCGVLVLSTGLGVRIVCKTNGHVKVCSS